MKNEAVEMLSCPSDHQWTLGPRPADIPLPHFPEGDHNARRLKTNASHRKRYWRRRFTEDLAKPWVGGYLAVLKWAVELLWALWANEAQLCGRYPEPPNFHQEAEV